MKGTKIVNICSRKAVFKAADCQVGLGATWSHLGELGATSQFLGACHLGLS
jgi:hypothetical protein